MTPASSEVERALARRLLAHEAHEAGESAAPRALPAATDRVLGQLHEHLTGWFGRDGAQAVLARALDRARVGHPALADARMEPQGEQRRPGLAGLPEPADDHGQAELTVTLVGFVASVIALLTRLIGADMVARLLQQAWPDVPIDPDPAPSATPPTNAADGNARATPPSTPHEDAPID